MPSHPAFLSCVLRLQIRDRNLCCRDAIGARAFRPAGKCRGLSEVLAFRRLQIPARDIKSGGCGHDNARAHRKHTAVVRTPARRIGSAIIVNQGAAVSSPPFQTSGLETAHERQRLRFGVSELQLVVLRSWKSFTSRKINQQLSREGTLWQRDYFDRLVRDQKHFANCVRYIRMNPERAGLRSGAYILYESELARSVE